MSFFESDDCANSELALECLTADEQNGLIQLPGSVVFADLIEPAEVMKSVRYGITFRVPKDAVIPGRVTPGNQQELTFGGVLFATAQHIADKVWGEGSPNTDAVWSALDAGINRKSSPFGVQDGDLSEYANDHGHWVVKASRAENKGRPSLYDRDGAAIFANNEEDDDSITNGELIGDVDEVAKFGDLVMVLCRLWAMDDYDRLNIEVVGVKTVAKGKGGGGRAAAIAAENASLNTLASGDFAMPANLALPAGPENEDEDEDEEPPKKAAKKSAAKKSAPKKTAKKKAAKKKGGKSVFRK